MPKKNIKFKDFINVDYTQDGEQRAINAKKRKRDSGEGTTEETDLNTEALSPAQRRRKAIQFKKIKNKIAIGRKRAARRVASTDVLKRRAQKQARNQIFKRITKNVSKDDLSFARRQEVEKRVDKLKPRIAMIAKRLLPKVRKRELERKRNSGNTAQVNK